MLGYCATGIRSKACRSPRSSPNLSSRCCRQPIRARNRRRISVASLRDEPFVYYPRSAGARAYEKPLTLCEEHGFRPQIVQEASHWLTILRLIAAGQGVSIAPACVRHIASAEVVCLPLRGAKAVSNIELAWLAGDSRPIVERFKQIAESTRRRSGGDGTGEKAVPRGVKEQFR